MANSYARPPPAWDPSRPGAGPSGFSGPFRASSARRSVGPSLRLPHLDASARARMAPSTTTTPGAVSRATTPRPPPSSVPEVIDLTDDDPSPPARDARPSIRLTARPPRPVVIDVDAIPDRPSSRPDARPDVEFTGVRQIPRSDVQQPARPLGPGVRHPHNPPVGLMPWGAGTIPSIWNRFRGGQPWQTPFAAAGYAFPSLSGFALPTPDYELVGLGEPPAPPAPEPPTYEAPEPAKDGFTRSPGEDDVVLCANCDEELGVGKTPEQRQVWFVRKCGHVSQLRRVDGLD